MAIESTALQRILSLDQDIPLPSVEAAISDRFPVETDQRVDIVAAVVETVEVAMVLTHSTPMANPPTQMLKFQELRDIPFPAHQLHTSKNPTLAISRRILDRSAAALAARNQFLLRTIGDIPMDMAPTACHSSIPLLGRTACMITLT